MKNIYPHSEKTNASNESKTFSGDLSFDENEIHYYTFDELEALFRSRALT